MIATGVFEVSKGMKALLRGRRGRPEQNVH
jgi:hypothetical protein